ncbi:sensor histidine kinase [Halosegnis marinus]|uniref:sensor histidine kinase n=1 Tax=Halosegnis marinus TaxID=3034023 RepID=UPI0036088106
MHRRRPWWLAGPLLAALSVGGTRSRRSRTAAAGRCRGRSNPPWSGSRRSRSWPAGSSRAGTSNRRPHGTRRCGASPGVAVGGDERRPHLRGRGARPTGGGPGVAVAAALGAVGGLYLGRARGRSVGATRTVAAQRDAFLFMNRMLRHHVLNGLNVIDGAAGMLADGTGTRAEHVDSIRSRSDAIARLVADARVVSDTLAGERVSVPTDVVPLVEQEVGALEARYPHATVSLDTPASATAAGGEFLAVVFEHLLSNAVVHNDGDAPRVWVTVRDRGRGIDVVVRDDGPGIDADAPFDPSRDPDGGFGLYLVNTLVTAAGGDVRVENDGGACVTVELRAG